jgi:hypothetical protein
VTRCASALVQCATARDVERARGQLERTLVAEGGHEPLVERADLSGRTSGGHDTSEGVDEQSDVRRTLAAESFSDGAGVLEEVDRFLVLELRGETARCVDSLGVLLDGDADDARQSPRGVFLRGERRGREGEA